VREPVCVGVHAVLVERAHDELLAAGAARVVTCDTIAHAVEPDRRSATLLAEGVRGLLADLS
jgi:ribose-phosphate pyrophosphokinase